MIAPWQWRRHVSKLLRYNDMIPDRAYDECIQRLYGYVVKTLKEREREEKKGKPRDSL